jgi:hypothetical protein
MFSDDLSFLNTAHVLPRRIYYFHLCLARVVFIKYLCQLLGQVRREFGIRRNIDEQNRAFNALNPRFIIGHISSQIIAINRIQNPDITIRISVIDLLFNSGLEIIPDVL